MCPECKQATLYSTGAFWLCAKCGLAITKQALMLERAAEASRERAPRTAEGEASDVASA